MRRSGGIPSWLHRRGQLRLCCLCQRTCDDRFDFKLEFSFSTLGPNSEAVDLCKELRRRAPLIYDVIEIAHVSTECRHHTHTVNSRLQPRGTFNNVPHACPRSRVYIYIYIYIIRYVSTCFSKKKSCRTYTSGCSLEQQ